MNILSMLFLGPSTKKLSQADTVIILFITLFGKEKSWFHLLFSAV